MRLQQPRPLSVEQPHLARASVVRQHPPAEHQLSPPLPVALAHYLEAQLLPSALLASLALSLLVVPARVLLQPLRRLLAASAHHPEALLPPSVLLASLAPSVLVLPARVLLPLLQLRSTASAPHLPPLQLSADLPPLAKLQVLPAPVVSLPPQLVSALLAVLSPTPFVNATPLVPLARPMALVLPAVLMLPLLRLLLEAPAVLLPTVNPPLARLMPPALLVDLVRRAPVSPVPLPDSVMTVTLLQVLQRLLPSAQAVEVLARVCLPLPQLALRAQLLPPTVDNATSPPLVRRLLQSVQHQPPVTQPLPPQLASSAPRPRRAQSAVNVLPHRQVPQLLLLVPPA